MEGKVFYMKTICYFTDPVLIIKDPRLFYGWRDTILYYRKIHTKP